MIGLLVSGWSAAFAKSSSLIAERYSGRFESSSTVHTVTEALHAVIRITTSRRENRDLRLVYGSKYDSIMG